MDKMYLRSRSMGKTTKAIQKSKERKNKRTIQLIQSRCVHRRRGVLSQDGHNVLYCQDCLKTFDGEDI